MKKKIKAQCKQINMYLQKSYICVLYMCTSHLENCGALELGNSILLWKKREQPVSFISLSNDHNRTLNIPTLYYFDIILGNVLLLGQK